MYLRNKHDIKDIKNSLEPNTLWNALKGATDVTANAFTIANNARQIATETQSTMLSKLADTTKAINKVTETVRNIS